MSDNIFFGLTLAEEQTTLLSRCFKVSGLLAVILLLPISGAFGAPSKERTARISSSGTSASERSVEPGSTRVKKILASAKDSLGKEMWKVGFGLSEGRLGCAASVSNVLKKAEINGVYSPVTKKMRQQIINGRLPVTELVLKDGGDRPIDDGKISTVAKPGDVVVAFMHPLPGADVGPGAHCGVIGESGTVFTNDWNNGIWSQGSIHTFFDSYKYIRLLRFK